MSPYMFRECGFEKNGWGKGLLLVYYINPAVHPTTFEHTH